VREGGSGLARGARQGRRVCLGSLCNPRDPPGADLHQPGFGKLGHMHVSCSFSSSLLHSKSPLAQFCSKQFSPASFSFGPSERLPVRTSRSTRGIRGAFPRGFVLELPWPNLPSEGGLGQPLAKKGNSQESHEAGAEQGHAGGFRRRRGRIDGSKGIGLESRTGVKKRTTGIGRGKPDEEA
jgi:hypothetical protein